MTDTQVCHTLVCNKSNPRCPIGPPHAGRSPYYNAANKTETPFPFEFRPVGNKLNLVALRSGFKLMKIKVFFKQVTPTRIDRKEYDVINGNYEINTVKLRL